MNNQTAAPAATETPIVLDWDLTWWEEAEMAQWAPDGTFIGSDPQV